MATTIAGTAIILAAALLLAVAAQPPAAAPGGSAPGPGGPAPGTGEAGPAAGPGTGSDCMTNLLNMSDCLTYVEAGSNLTKPDAACCPELAGLVESHPTCLCLLLGNTTDTIGVAIELKKALNLPTVCGVQTPSLSLCSVVGYPVPGPVLSQLPLSPGSGGLSPAGLASSPASGSSGSGTSSATAVSQLSFLPGLAIGFLTTLFFFFFFF